MGFNYGYEKKKFDSRWKRLEVQEYIAKCTHRAKPVEKSATYRKLRSVRA